MKQAIFWICRPASPIRRGKPCPGHGHGTYSADSGGGGRVSHDFHGSDEFAGSDAGDTCHYRWNDRNHGSLNEICRAEEAPSGFLKRGEACEEDAVFAAVLCVMRAVLCPRRRTDGAHFGRLYRGILDGERYSGIYARLSRRKRTRSCFNVPMRRMYTAPTPETVTCGH